MKHITRICLFSIITALSANTAAEVAVIVHPTNTANLSKAEVERIYLGKMNEFPTGGAVIAFNLPEGAPIRTEFDETFVGKTPNQLKAFWSKQLFTGKGTPPKELSDAAAMKAKVSSNPSAIGYIDAAVVDDSVRVIQRQ